MNKSTVPYADVLSQELSSKTQLKMRGTWGGWEWNHASPHSDPYNYQDTEGVLMTYAFNRLYTVSNPKDLDAFQSKSGLSMIRHYVLNETGFDKRECRSDILFATLILPVCIIN